MYIYIWVFNASGGLNDSANRVLGGGGVGGGGGGQVCQAPALSLD